DRADGREQPQPAAERDVEIGRHLRAVGGRGAGPLRLEQLRLQGGPVPADGVEGFFRQRLPADVEGGPPGRVRLERDSDPGRVEQPADGRLLVEPDAPALDERDCPHRLPPHGIIPAPGRLFSRSRRRPHRGASVTDTFAYDAVEYPSTALPN